ncbi:MAG: endonuclease III [Oscillospiraceae bacterium]|jgi:endonuclease-3|nr:endonuclease III [Oscillospiraceae bacterium]
MTENKKKQAAKKAIEALKKLYPNAKCSLSFKNPLQLLIATRLSAQCTDERVNRITPALFNRYPTLEDFADADVAEIEQYIHSCGLYKTKARDIVAAARMLRDKYDGKIPDTIEQLLKLPGVGRKTANLIIGDVYGKPAVVTDTHCIRISNRLGLCNTTNPVKVESELKKILPAHESNDFCHRLVLFGRDICRARSPRCTDCPIEWCPSKNAN